MRKNIRHSFYKFFGTTLLSMLLTLLVFGLVVGCGSHPIKPEADNVKVSREEADEECKDLGPVEGTVSTKSGTFEQALENMKIDAARKGANFVKMEATSAYGTATRGNAYFCP